MQHVLADVDHADLPGGSPPPLLGGWWYSASALSCLLESSAQPRHAAHPSPCPQGDNTALHWADTRGHVEVVCLLLVSGADRQVRNGQERLPIDQCPTMLERPA